MIEQFTLKNLIDEKGYSQSEFLKLFNEWLKDQQKNGKYVDQPKEGFSPKDLSRWITGKVKMRKSKLEMFAEYFGVAPNSIVNREPDDPSSTIRTLNGLLNRLLNGDIEITINIKFKEGELNGRNIRQQKICSRASVSNRAGRDGGPDPVHG